MRVAASTEYLDFVADVALSVEDFHRLTAPAPTTAPASPSLTRMTPPPTPPNVSSEAGSSSESCVVQDLVSALWLIEINTPVYLLATSGNWQLSNPAHREILFGDLSSVLHYPCVLASVEGQVDLVELF